MPTSEQIQSERKKLLAELAQLDQIRRGSLTEQMVEAIARDGQRRKRGPYPLYTYKEHGEPYRAGSRLQGRCKPIESRLSGGADSIK